MLAQQLRDALHLSALGPPRGETCMVNSTWAWYCDKYTILSIEVTSTSENCLRNASLLSLASAWSVRRSRTAS